MNEIKWYDLIVVWEMMTCHYMQIFVKKNLKGKYHLPCLGIDGSIMLRLVLNRVWTVFIWI